VRALRPALTLVLLVTALSSLPSAKAHEPAAHRQMSPSHVNGLGPWTHGPDPVGETNDAQRVSDLFDGVDRAFTFRAVATPEARFYEWSHCEGQRDDYDPATCRVIVSDTTPQLSVPPPGVAQVAVFEATADVTLEDYRLLAANACIEGPPVTRSHCENDALRIHWDDADTPSVHDPTTSGHILQPAHGQAVPNDGFTAMAYTSDDDIGRIQFCLDVGMSPTQEADARFGQGCDLGVDASRDTRPNDSPICADVPAGANCWELFIDPPDDTEFALGIIEQDHRAMVESGSGECEGDTTIGGDGQNTGDDCQLDKVYLTSVVAPPPAPGPSPTPPTSVLGATQTACPGFAGDPRNQVVGTKGPDTLVGSSGQDIVCGLGGKDVLRSKGGGDVILGGGGADRLIGGPGHDRLRGGPGRDILVGGPGRDQMSGGPGSDLCRGRAQDSMSRCRVRPP
jgi:hypothetical protein